MKRVILFVFAGILAAIQAVSAQNTSVKGKISDATNHNPIEYANVLLLKSDSTFVSGASSDFEGTFEIKNVLVGSYLLSASYLSYEILYQIAVKMV